MERRSLTDVVCLTDLATYHFLLIPRLVPMLLWWYTCDLGYAINRETCHRQLLSCRVRRTVSSPVRAEDDKITEKDLVVTRLSLTLDEETISQFIDKAIDIPVVAQRQVHVNRNVQKTKEISQMRYVGYQAVDVPVVMVVQVPQ